MLKVYLKQYVLFFTLNENRGVIQDRDIDVLSTFVGLYIDTFFSNNVTSKWEYLQYLKTQRYAQLS